MAQVTGRLVTLDGEEYFRIGNSHLMDDFFMSLVGAGDHWMFVSSSGALTAGRRSADTALFPYLADDQITASRGGTGPATIIRPADGDGAGAPPWEPFLSRIEGPHRFSRNLYKTPLGNKLVFEEINESLGLAFRYRWAFSERFGFVRSCRLENTGTGPRSLHLLDGLRNVLPHGVGREFMMRFSNLANAYKKCELLPGSGIGLFYLSSIPTDRAEPSEGLKATTVWQTGLTPAATLLAADQVASFRQGLGIAAESDVRGRPGAFLVHQAVDLAPGGSIEWHVVAEVARDHSDVVALDAWRQETPDAAAEIAADIRKSEEAFIRILSSSDAFQCGANRARCHRHLSSTVFNVMRGGLPLDGYRLRSADFRRFVATRHRPAAARNARLLDGLPPVLDAGALHAAAADGDADLARLSVEYLPFAFSRRHGDPTRPWNHFVIDLKDEDGRTNLNYQGNWRDLFQNWEALLVSFPGFAPGMICRFLNATTADGYNPYRVTRDGFEWEEPSPDDPWANIGYWGDHQIIYLLKLLEWHRAFHPGDLDRMLGRRRFTHANVPYRIRSAEAIRADPRHTIDYDEASAAAIARRVAEIGEDGKLLADADGAVLHVTLIEKLLTLTLAKLSNFVPDGGIWLNTQRPEWNDANNALVGNGLSMVTVCYLHRWCRFIHDRLAEAGAGSSFEVSGAVAGFFRTIRDILRTHEPVADSGSLAPGDRLAIVEALTRAGSDYRETLYSRGLDGPVETLALDECLEFFASARRHLEATIRRNRRPDGLYHSYNLIGWTDGRAPARPGVEIEPLAEMLEGQVAVLSAGLLTPTESLEVLDALRAGALYREDQESYLLYPDRQLPRFLEKNILPTATAASNPLVQRHLESDDRRIVRRDVRGEVHFNGAFRNSADLRAALARLGEQDTEAGRDLAAVFDEIFGHRRFTGRSGTFFAYEGLGSIYWHMVSKLALAVSETCLSAREAGADGNVTAALEAHLRRIQHGIGAEKPPATYGAFPSDPYSHTPEKAGVKQPGMTGQVKEDILTRFADLGIRIDDGCLGFDLDLFDRSELLEAGGDLCFVDIRGEATTVRVPASGFGFTLFQVPVVYLPGDADSIQVDRFDGGGRTTAGSRLDRATSAELFSRSGTITGITCRFQRLTA